MPVFYILFQAKEVERIHRNMCPKARAENGLLKTQLSCDGVSECRSNLVSMDVYSTRIIGCKQIYPHKIVRPLKKSFQDKQNHLGNVLTDLGRNGFELKHFVGDNPKRADAKCVLNHSSQFPCEYCFCRGTNFTPKSGPNEPKKRSRIVWPASSMNAEPRTDRKVREIVEKIENEPNLSKLEKKGIVGRSPLLDVPNFSYVRDSPTEYMHSVCIGVVKRLLELTFNIGENRARNTNRLRSCTEEFNKCMIETKVTRETSRRARQLDFSVMKAQELRNICLFFFPHVLQCLEPNAKERKLWILLAFMIRSCVLPSSENFDIDAVKDACSQFYCLYENLFGLTNCTYNTHVVCSHLIEMRVHGPLTLTSAFGFEAFYGEMRHSFTPGTQSPLKQIFQKTILKRVISHHCCENTIFYSAKDTPLESNSMIYVYKNHTYHIYKIKKVTKDTLICFPQGKYAHTFRECPNLDFAMIGVFKKGGIMKKKRLSRKKMSVGKYLLWEIS